ncbi:MAG: cytochrome-c peroxidase [Deltaproteobacteria bacterium]|nr:cytochrome-c peroxidase [Deltaproteobacteria bacterium]
MIFVILILLVSSPGYLIAAEGPSVELGKKLFNDKTLGGATGSVSCATCHPGGKGEEMKSVKASDIYGMNTRNPGRRFGQMLF